MKPLWGLDFWNSGEWQVILERLSDLDKAKVKYCPAKKNVLRSLRVINPEDVRVIILGQDPYPQSKYATGIAFSIPDYEEILPPTLVNIFEEYEDDLKYPYPTSGDLSPWCSHGVLLFNVLPTCLAGKSLSHNWDEYRYFTWAILDKLADQSAVLVTLGSIPKSFLRDKDYDNFEVLSYGHPSPRGNLRSKNPFKGSRMFSTINWKLCESHLKPINWRLP